MERIKDLAIVARSLASSHGYVYLAEVAEEVAEYPQSPHLRKLLLRYLRLRHDPAFLALASVLEHFDAQLEGA
jgi:hypothetical protein